MSDRIKRLCRLALLMSAALILSYVESFIGPQLAVPGIKIGIGNVIVTYIIYEYGFFTALGFGICRAVLSMLFTGRISSVFYSVTGIVLAVCAMWLVSRMKCFSPLGVNVSGSVFHITGQFIAAVFVLATPGILSVFPVYIALSVVSGIITYIPLRIVLTRFGADGKKTDKRHLTVNTSAKQDEISEK